MPDAARVFIVSDDECTSELLDLVLRQDARIVIVGRAANGTGLLHFAPGLSPDIILVDLDSPGQATLASLRSAKQQMSSAAMVGLAGDHDINRALVGDMDALLSKRETLSQLLASLDSIGFRARSRSGQSEYLMEDSLQREIEQPSPVVEQIELAPTTEKTSGPELPSTLPPAAVGSMNVQTASQVEAHHQTESPKREVTSPPASLPLPNLSQPPASAAPASQAEASISLPRVEPVAGSFANTADGGDQGGPILVEIAVSPFGSFRALSTFHAALEGLSDVVVAKIRRFHRGTLYETVRYAGTVPLEERLKELVLYEPTVVESGPGSIELRINAGEERILDASTPE